ncbi:MAG: T9SS type A sorting domain-containing protein [Bacteroidales bacterium]|nr:T9SS type A sorting domain-containing protein [Bacteroidales bacterium]
MVILFSCCHFLPAHSQGEWKWVNYWTGNDDPLNTSNPYNYVVRTAFDDDGNVYVFGSFGGNARVYDQTMSAWISDMVEVVAANTQGTVLMKFDSSGNFLWSRLVKNTKQSACPPYDMVLKDGKIVISGAYYFSASLNEKLWFLDTLITQQTAESYPSGEHNPPYTYGYYSYFSVLDLEGNILENHFVKTLSRALENRFAIPISARYGATPMSMDSNGNIYLAAAINYGGPDTLPWTVVIDEDSAKTYDIFLPGTASTWWIDNMMVFKFSPEFDLQWTKIGVFNMEKVSQDASVGFVDPNDYGLCKIGGLLVDDNDGLYLSGYLSMMNDYFDENNLNLMRVYWDSTHYATVDDRGLAMYLPFIIKYDSDGNVQWSNQAYISAPPSTGAPNTIQWTDNFVYDSSVYLAGWITHFPGSSAFYYFDNENNAVNVSEYTTFFVRFDKEDGHFESVGVVPGEQTVMSISGPTRPAVINNHIAFLPNQRALPYNNILLTVFNVDGTFDKADTIYQSYNTVILGQRVLIKDDGHLLCDFASNQDLSFGHDLSLTFDNHLYSHAVVAYRYDPSILTPYPEDSTGVAQHAESSPVRLYPNPTCGMLHVESEGTPIDRVYVLDLAGKELLRRDVHGNRGEIDVSSLPSGMYVLRTVCGGETHVGKFVKTEL